MPNKKELNIEDILKILPHRYPFLLIDKINYVDDTTVKAQKNVTINEPFFAGHFPNKPVMPGVLQIEAMAQAAGFLLFNNESKGLGVLAGVDDARFKKMILPGDVLEINITLLQKRKNILKAACQILKEGTVASSAVITLILS